MNEVIYLIFRQMRRPALIIIVAYSVAVLGMSLIPITDESGNIVHLSIFQSFYWISYTATTIGYGEVPMAFSNLQRVWVTLSIYYTVPTWLYAAGKIIALLSDPTFQHALKENSFSRKVNRLRDKFVVVCGFGESGYQLISLLLEAGYHCVVIDKNADRINRIVLDPKLHSVLALTGDAGNVALLERAGIRSQYCNAVVALTDDEKANIKIAISARLLATHGSNFKVICRTMSREASANAKSFDTDIIINTNQIFAEHLTMALRCPSIADLIHRFCATPGSSHSPRARPPYGRWIICGRRQLGETLERFLQYEGIDTTIIDDSNAQLPNQVYGSGTEEVTLREAHIHRANAIVAGRDYDPDNLSIVMTAKKLNPSLFVVGRLNNSINRKLFDIANFDYVMEEANLIVNQVFIQIANPVLGRFLRLLRHQSESWGSALLAKIQILSGDANPYQCVLRIDEENAPAVVNQLNSGHLLRMQSLWTRPDDKATLHDALPLLLIRQGREILLPNPATNLQYGDKILIVHPQPHVASRIARTCMDEGELYWAVHGKNITKSYVLSYIFRKLE